MNAETSPTPAPASRKRREARQPSADASLDPWAAIAGLEYGADRSYAWTVRERVVNSPPESRAAIEQSLLKSLARPGCTAAGRAFICEMLALVASPASVPALAPLLRDAKTADAARYALEPVPGPEADAALREALPALSGNAKAGLIGSIGVRGDPAARPALAALQDAATEPAVVREAATRALERLANLKA